MQLSAVASSGLRVTPAVQSSDGAIRRGAAIIPRVAAPEASPAGDSSMELGAESFIRPHLLKLKAYTPIEPFEILAQRLGREPKDIVKLDANENPYGPPPEVLAALGSMAFPNIYPDPESRRLREALAKWNNVPMEHLLVSGAPVRIALLAGRRSAGRRRRRRHLEHFSSGGGTSQYCCSPPCLPHSLSPYPCCHGPVVSLPPPRVRPRPPLPLLLTPPPPLFFFFKLEM